MSKVAQFEKGKTVVFGPEGFARVEGIGEREVLQHQGIAGTEGRAAEGGGGGSHRRDGGEPHPHRPAAAPRQGRPEAMPPGAHGPILDAA